MRSDETYIYERQLKNIYRDSFTGVYTERDAEKIFVDILKEKGLYDNFVEKFKSSDQVLIRELAKTYLINLSTLADYKISALWLQTTKSLSDAYDLVRFYDYSIVRKRAPVLRVKYIGEDTLHLTRGDVVGNYKGLDIVCTEESMYLEYGDIKSFKLGKLKSGVVPILGNEVKVVLKPTDLSAIDNDEVRVYVEGSQEAKPITKHIKEYIRGGSVRDFSIDNTGTELYLVDYTKKYGLYTTPTDVNFQVSYLETDGLFTGEFDFNKVAWVGSFKTKLEFAVIDYAGYDGDTIETLKTYAPLVSSSKGSATSFHQYRTFTAYLPEFYDTNPYKEDGTGVERVVKVLDANTPFVFQVEGRTYTFTKVDTDMVNKVVSDFDDGYKIFIHSDTVFTIAPTNYKAVNRFVPVSNLSITSENPAIEPQCCVLMVPYIRYNLAKGIDPLVYLTDSEKESVGKASEKFKSWNVELKYYPATVREIDIPISVQMAEGVTSSANLDEAIKKVFSFYEYKIGAEVPVPEILARVANIVSVNVGEGYKDMVIAVDTPLKDKVFKAVRDQYFKIKPVITYKAWSR